MFVFEKWVERKPYQNGGVSTRKIVSVWLCGTGEVGRGILA